MTTENAPAEAPIRFQEAMNELDGILAKLDRDEVDLDDLSDMVERAAELIRVCRSRIVNTEQRVQQILHQLDEDLTPPENDSEPSEDT